MPDKTAYGHWEHRGKCLCGILFSFAVSPRGIEGRVYIRVGGCFEMREREMGRKIDRVKLKQACISFEKLGLV